MSLTILYIIMVSTSILGIRLSLIVTFFLSGTLLCVVLVYCNLAVIQALYAITAPRTGGLPVVRRVSKSSCRQRDLNRSLNSGNNLTLHHNAATAEEVAFSRLMATLSVLFMICWLPQMVSWHSRTADLSNRCWIPVEYCNRRDFIIKV